MPNLITAKGTALEILREFGLTVPPINPIEISHHLGVKVNFVTFAPDYSGISGFYDPEEDAIYVNNQEYPLRQTFTVAHELGHRMLHKEWAQSNDYKVLMRSGNAENDVHELEANEFAGNLLVPRPILDRYRHLTRPNLSKLFAVSVPTISVRLSKEYGI